MDTLTNILSNYMINDVSYICIEYLSNIDLYLMYIIELPEVMIEEEKNELLELIVTNKITFTISMFMDLLLNMIHDNFEYINIVSAYIHKYEYININLRYYLKHMYINFYEKKQRNTFKNKSKCKCKYIVTPEQFNMLYNNMYKIRTKHVSRSINSSVIHKHINEQSNVIFVNY